MIEEKKWKAPAFEGGPLIDMRSEFNTETRELSIEWGWEMTMPPAELFDNGEAGVLRYEVENPKP